MQMMKLKSAAPGELNPVFYIQHGQVLQISKKYPVLLDTFCKFAKPAHVGYKKLDLALPSPPISCYRSLIIPYSCFVICACVSTQVCVENLMFSRKRCVCHSDAQKYLFLLLFFGNIVSKSRMCCFLPKLLWIQRVQFRSDVQRSQRALVVVRKRATECSRLQLRHLH